MKLDFKDLPLEKIFLVLTITGIFGAYSLSYYLHNGISPLLFVETSVLWVPILLAFICLYFLYRSGFDLPEDNIFVSKSQYLQKIVFVFLLTLSILSCALNPYRPWYYFLLIALMFSIIFVQIFSKPLNSHLILFEIVLTLLNLIFSQTLNYQYYFGGTDILDHVSWSEFVLVSGGVPPFEFAGFYTFFPLFQVYNAVGALLTGAEMKILYFLLAGITYCAGIIFLYVILRNSQIHEQIALLSCLLFATFAYIIHFGTYMITRSVAAVGFLFLIFLYLKLVRSRHLLFQFSALLLLYFVFIMLVHHVSIIHILPLFALFILFSALVIPDIVQRYKVLPIFIIIVGSYWMYVSWIFLRELIQKRLDLHFYENIALSPSWGIERKFVSDTLAGTLNYIWMNLDTGIFLFFYIVGVSYILYKKKPAYGMVYLALSILTIPFFLPTPLQSIWQLEFVMGFGRLVLFAGPFMVIIMAFGVYTIVNHIYQKNSGRLFVLILAVFFFFSLFSNITWVNAGDSLDLNTYESATHFDTTDIAAFVFLDNFLDPGSDISSDITRKQAIWGKSFPEWEKYGIRHFTTHNIYNFEDITKLDSYFLFPRYEFYEQGGLVFYNTVFTPSEHHVDILEKSLDDQDKVYSSGSNELYYSIR